MYKFRPAVVLGTSFGITAVGLGMLFLADGSSGLGVLVAASVIISLALSPMFNLTTELIVGSAPPERAGAASGISETGAEFGGALGISILGSIGTAVYRGGLADGLPQGIPAEAAEVARDTLGGAVGVAAQLPGQIGTALLDVARTSFVQGMHTVAGIAAAIAIIAAIVGLTVLRNIPSGSPHEKQPDVEARGDNVIELDMELEEEGSAA
jgi:DHA2 family multidrug resistance protein-like MFS transporter